MVKQAFKDTVKELNKINPDEVEAFVVLVKGPTYEDDKKCAKGINALCGPQNALFNLLSNLNSDLMEDFILVYLAMRLKR